MAEALASALKSEGDWYAELRSDAEHVVIFAERHSRDRRGDEQARAETIEYGVPVGVPAHQLDWPD